MAADTDTVTTASPRWAGWPVLAALIIVATGLRIFIAPFAIYHPDSGLYLQLADAIRHGALHVQQGSAIGLYQPGYSAVVMLCTLVISDAEVAGTIVSLLAGAVGMMLTYVLGKTIRNAATGMLAALLVAVHPLLAFYSGLVLTESLFTALLILTVLFTVRLTPNASRRHLGLLGALIGCSYLVRVVGVGSLLPVSLWVWYGWRGRRRTQLLLALWLGAAVVAGPYLIYLKSMTGHWRVTGQQGRALYNFQYADTRDVRDGKLTPDGRLLQDYALAQETTFIGMLRTGADVFIANAGKNLVVLYQGELPLAFSPLMLVFLGLGLARPLSGPSRAGDPADNTAKDPADGSTAAVAALADDVAERSRPLSYPALIAWWAAPTLILHVFTGVDERYLTPLAPLAAPLVGAGMLTGAGYLRRSWAVAAFAALLAVAALPYWQWTEAFHLENARPLREAGAWIKEHAGATQPKIMTRYPFVAYWAGGEQIWVPKEDPPQVIAFARREGARYIVVDSNAVFQHEPLMRPFLNGPDPPPGVRLLHWIESINEKRVVYIYQVQDTL